MHGKAPNATVTVASETHLSITPLHVLRTIDFVHVKIIDSSNIMPS
jgi:hypothetical protein